jgi:hypothetical protein
MVRLKTRIENLNDALEFLGGKDERTIAHNTRIVRRDDGIAVRYHYTDIVLYKFDGKVVLNNGGWQTTTTRDRIRMFAPYARLAQKDFTWYVGEERFYNGFTLSP